MTGLTIAWEYLTGYAVATDPSTREEAEWPPHPARVFMAMAAAWFETGEDPAEGAALRWLESLGEPELQVPPREDVAERRLVTVYVPVNDRAGPSAAQLHSAPTITRNKQPRSFPRCFVGSRVCALRWPAASGGDAHADALNCLCERVSRIGHSSSLVRMWVTEDGEEQTNACAFVPEPVGAEFRVRRVAPGLLESLDQQFGEKPRERRALLESRIAALEAEKKGIKGKGGKERKVALDADIRRHSEELDQVVVRDPVRPRIGLWTGYRRAVKPNGLPATSILDADVLVLTACQGTERISVHSTLAVSAAMRNVVMRESGVQPVPRWVSGHEEGGEPDRSGAGHMAVLPLGFVSRDQVHADGSLLGVALAFPQNVDRGERGRVLGPVLVDEHGEPKPVRLTLGRWGVWDLRLAEPTDDRATVRVETWTAGDGGAMRWCSATPVVLDRFPKADRAIDREGWEDEVAAIIRQSCASMRLPVPKEVAIGTTSWLHGSPRAMTKQRRLRDEAIDSTALTGDGFPGYSRRRGSAGRPQVHVMLEFDVPVVGPVAIGAGRYRGYGLLKPESRVRGGRAWARA